MNSSTGNLTILGEQTSRRGVKGQPSEEWLEHFPLCLQLAEYGVIHLGVVEAARPYRVMQSNPETTLFLASLSGEGSVLVDGQWARCGAESAILLPCHRATGYYALGAVPWRFVWVSYGEAAPVTMAGTPGIAPFHTWALFHAVEALREESMADQDPVCQRAMINLVHNLVLRYTAPWRQEDRLRSLWEKVAAALNAEWSLEQLAGEAHCSPEHLRRLCQRQLRRSPMQHVTHLRLVRASEQLLGTDLKVETIAAEVGYQDPFTFSARFKKSIGTSPTDYRKRRGLCVAS